MPDQRAIELINKYMAQERHEAEMQLKAGKGVAISPTSLSGALWFSEKEWWALRNKGRDRTYGELSDGRIVEYTELISLDMLSENPEDCCSYPDAVFLGMGKFSRWEEYRG